MNNNRISWLDSAKFTSIFLIMLYHLEIACDEFGCVIAPFLLPIFFTISGYLHKPGQKFSQFFIKKVKGLFVPWLIFGVLDILISNLVSIRAHNGFIKELLWNFLQVRGFHDQMWFVAALFLAFIPFYFFVEWYEKSGRFGKFKTEAFIVISVLLYVVDIIYCTFFDGSRLPWGTVALPWHIEYLFQAMFFMFLGYAFKVSYEAGFDKINSHLTRLIGVLIYLFLAWFPYFLTVQVPDWVFNIFSRFIMPTMGIALVFAFCKVIKPGRFVSYVGQNTIIYFALHGKVYSLLLMLITRFLGGFYMMMVSSKILSCLFALGITFIVAVILLVPTYIINRFFPFVVGRKRKVKA